MKIKTFILTFLMMMSCSILFGQELLTGEAKTESKFKQFLFNYDYGTITIGGDFSVSSTIEIPKGRKITIDLNGHKLTTNADIYIFKNFGQLTITDNSTDGKGTISSLGIYNGKPQTRTNTDDIDYTAQLTIKGGVFENISPDGGAAIYNHLGVIDIQGGEFYGEYSAITNFGLATIANAYIECLNRDNGAAAIINDFEIEYGNNVNVVGIYTAYNNSETASITDGEATYLFAELKGTKTKYPSLQAALDACTTGDNTINLLFHNSDNATVSQKEGVNITIDGDGYKDKQFEYTGTIYVNGNSRHTGTETLTIQDVNFVTTDNKHDFISCNDGGDPVIRYAHNVTVQKCNFTATEASTEVVALRFRQSYNINVKESVFTNLHSAMWATGTSGIAFDNIEATNCKEGGISAGTSTPVSVKNSIIEGAKYGVRADGSGDYRLTVESSELTAEVPVIVRNTTGEYNLTVKEDATLASTTNGPQVVVTAGKDNEAYVTPTSDVNVTLDNVTSTFGLTAKIGNAFYATLQDAVDNAKTSETVTLVTDCAETVTFTQTKDVSFVLDGNDKTYTGSINITARAGKDAPSTLVIKNFNFETDKTSHDFIKSVETNYYPNNITITGCSFEGTSDINTEDYAVVAVRLKSANNIKIENCTGTGLHSFLQNTAGWDMTIGNVEITNSLSGFAMGTIQGVNIKDCDITAKESGIRLDAQYDNKAVIESNKIEAFIPVVVRKASVNGTITFDGTNEFTETNTDGLWCAIGTSEYKENGVMPTAATASVSVTLNGTGLDRKGIYGSALNGEGTVDNPYLIETVNDLVFFRDQVNGGNNYAGKHVKLATNIDLSSIENWTPIGDITYNINNNNNNNSYQPADNNKVFSGVFNGNDKVISNLTINRTVGGADTQANVGFFGITGEGADIKDLTLTNVNIETDGRNVGALAGFAYKATLSNITVNGNIQIKGGNNVSGVAGMTRYYDMSATNIKVIGNDGSAIDGNNIVGGIFAEIAPNGSVQTFESLSVENVAITGVSGVGGIVGLLTTGAVDKVTVKNVVLTGRTDYQGNAMGRIRLGSIAGLMGGQYATIANVTTEDVTAKNLDGDAVELPVIGANYDAASNATEAKIGDTYYATLSAAFAAVQADVTITLLADANISATLKVNNNITLDLNGKTITGTDNVTNSFALIEIQPGKELVVNDATGNGKITLTATNNRGWNAYSSVISNQRGKLTIENGTIEHLGGTDMAYAIDNLTNTGNQIAETIVNGGIIKSTYRAIRQFLNSSAEGVNNILTINRGTVEGANKSIWMQEANTSANPGKLTVSIEAAVKGDILLSAQAGATEWPVEVSIAAEALKDNSTVSTNDNVPAGYELKVTNGVWGVEYGVAKIGDVLYATLQDAVNVGGEVKVIANITLDQTVTVAADKTVVLDLNGKTISTSAVETSYAINNLGTLTLKDSSEGKTGAVNARGIYNGYGNGGDNVASAKIIVESGTYNAKGTNGGAAIYNYGIAEINGGTFTSIGGYSLNNQSGSSMTVADGVTANNGIYVSGATLTINGGDIDGNRSGCHVVYAWNSTVTINGGDFYNNNSGNATIMAAGTTQMTIKGGIFGIKDGRVQGNANTWTSCLTDTQNTATMIVIGGTFNGGFRVQNGTTMTIEGGSFNDCFGSGYNILGTATVKGGTFTDNAAITFAENNLADGFKLEENADGTYGVVPFVEKSYEINEETTLAQAIAQAKEDGAEIVTYTIYGAATLETGGSHGIVDFGGREGYITIKGGSGNTRSTDSFTITGGGVPDIKGVTFKDLTFYDEGTYLPTANEFMYQNFIDCTFENVTFEDGIRLSGNSVVRNCTFNANTNDEYAIWLDEGTFEMTGSTVTAGNDAYGLLKSDVVDKITISDNTFQYLAKVNKEALNVKGATIVATDNTFIDCAKGVVPADKVNYTADGTTQITDAIIAEDNEIIIYVAKIGNVKYQSLAEAATAAANNATIQLLWAEGHAPIAMAATIVNNKTVTITGTADVDWDKGWLYVGRNGEGNGKLIFREANLTSKSVGVYGNGIGLNVSCKKEGQSTTNDGEVEIINSNIQLDYLIGKGNIKLDNSTLNVYEGFAVGARPASETGGVQRIVTMDITNGSNVIVKNHNGQGLGYESMGIMNIDATSTFKTTQSFLVTADGTMNNAGTVEITGTLTNNGTINFTGLDAKLTAQGGLTIVDEVDNPNYAIAYLDGTYQYAEYVAQIGDEKYLTLQEAIDAAQNDETITLLVEVEQADGVIIDSKNIVVDLNEKTFTVTEGANTNNRNFKIKGTSVVTIKNGTMVAAGDYSSGAYGTVRTEGAANVTLTGLKLYNYRGNGLNIKALGGTTVEIDNTEIYSQYGGGIEAAGGTITLAETVKVEQKGMYTAPYNSMAISVNGGGLVTVNGGTYSTECITAEEANNQGTSHGPWVVGVLNSGGKLIINGGTFSNDNFGDNSLATYARGAVLADTGAEIEIKGGTFNALEAIIDMTNNLGDANNNPSALLSGGTFSADPRISGMYASHLIVVAQGYNVVENEDGTYSVVEDQVAKIGDVTYKLLHEAFNAAQDGDEIVVLKDITYTKANGYVNGEYIDGLVYTGDKSFTVNFDGHTITDNGDINDYLVYLNNKSEESEKDNEITFKNGTIAINAERNTTAWAAITVGANSAKYETTLNLNDMKVVNGNPNNANNQVIRTRKGATVNLNDETVVTSNGTSYGVVAETDGTVNIYSGAKVVHTNSGTTGGDLVYTAVSGNGTINIYDGATIESDNYAIHNMTTGNTVINIYGGTIKADEVAVHVATNGGNGESAVANISGGTFTGKLETYTGAASIVISGGIFSVNPTEYLAEGYGAIELADHTWFVRMIAGTQSRELGTGWYWFSTYIQDMEGETGVATIKSELDGKGREIKSHNQYARYLKAYDTWTGGLSSLSTAEMYMINTTGAVTIDLTGAFVEYETREIELKEGWNWIGYPVNEELDINVALKNLEAKEGDYFKGKNQGEDSWYFDGRWIPSFNLKPGHGYMYQSTQDATFTFNAVNDKNNTNVRTVVENYHWNADATQYPSNMTMIAVVDGAMGDNYEVAAFVNGEVRGSAHPVFIERLNSSVIILTIHGDEVAEVTFKYYDIATGEEIELANRINYSSDAIVGSMAEPYMLTRGTTGIGEASLSEINIYPNPTTTGTEINLQATCDKVEVFNALGAKVAEYQNVDSIDALETAGIYVIRITNDSNVQNCKLVVR